MAILEIQKYGAPVLQKKAEKVKEITEDLRKMIVDMPPTMEEASGVGLAAPQVGVSKRVIAVQGDTGPSVFINPEIVKKGELAEEAAEGCLSLPGIWLNVKRAKEVEVKALTPEGKEVVVKATGLAARIFQHEIDHLNGKLIVDRQNPLKRRKAIREYKRTSKQ